MIGVTVWESDHLGRTQKVAFCCTTTGGRRVVHDITVQTFTIHRPSKCRYGILVDNTTKQG